LTAPRCLIVLAHPLGESLNARLATTVEAEARAAGWAVTRRDLYATDFDPRLTQAERTAYYADRPSQTLKADRIAQFEARLRTDIKAIARRLTCPD
jgi:NAD(P)H dehydrogenase (quinone)